MRGSAYFDKGEYDIAISDFDEAFRSVSSLLGEVYLAEK